MLNQNLNYFKPYIFLIVFFSSWTSAFAFEWITWISIPTIVSFIVLLTYIIFFVFKNQKATISRVAFYKEDFLILIFLFIIFIKTFFSSNLKTTNYLLAYFLTFTLIYYLYKNILLNFGKLKYILQINLITIVLVSIFGITDFFLQIFFNFRINDYIPRNVPSFSIFSTLGFPRNAGLTEEPTYLAWYYNCMGLFALWYLFKSKVNYFLKLILTLIIAISYLTTFSSAGIPILIIFTIFHLFILSKKKIIFVIIIFCFVSLLIYLANQDNDFNLLLPVIEKLSLEGTSGEDRGSNLNEGIIAFKENPLFGKGLGYYASIGRSSFINYYLFLATETGVFPPIIFIMFLLSVYYKIWKYQGPAKSIMLISFSSGAVHLFTQSSFYHPYFWLMIIFVYKFLQQEKEFSISE